MKKKPHPIKEFAVFDVFVGGQMGTKTFIYQVDDIKPSPTFAEAERRLLRKLHKPRTQQSPIGYSESVLTILPLYRLSDYDPNKSEGNRE